MQMQTQSQNQKPKPKIAQCQIALVIMRHNPQSTMPLHCTRTTAFGVFTGTLKSATITTWIWMPKHSYTDTAATIKPTWLGGMDELKNFRQYAKSAA